MPTKNIKQKTYFIKGMHCAACEIFVEKTLIKEKNIQSVEASLSNNSVKVFYKGKIPVDDINKKLGQNGYELLANKPQNYSSFNVLDFAFAFAVVVFLLGFYFLLRSLGVLDLTSFTGGGSYFSYFILGLVAGVSSCAALVGGLLLSLSKQWVKQYANETSQKKYIPFYLFNTGRIIGFALFGGILGIIGAVISINFTFTVFLTIAVSILMIFIALQMFGLSAISKLYKTPKAISKLIEPSSVGKSKTTPFVIGALTILIPCGFTLIAQAQALASGSFISGFLILLFFVLGTLPVLAVISFSSVNLYKNTQFSGVFSYTVALLLIVFGLYTINSQLNVLGVASFQDLLNKPSRENVEDSKTVNPGEEQILNLEASGFEYFPKYQTIKVGVPTTIKFNNKGAVGCAVAAYSRGLFNDVMILEPGINEQQITPKAGKYKVTCTMGMVSPVVVEVK